MSDRPSYAKDPLFLDTAPARHLSQDIALQQSLDEGIGQAISTVDGWEAALVDLSRDRNFSKARTGTRAWLSSRGVASAAGRPAGGLENQARAIPSRRGCRSRGRAAAGAVRRDRSLRSAQGPHRQAGLPRSAPQGARSGEERRRASAAAFSSDSPTSSSTSSRTPIPCRPSCCSCWRPRIRTRPTGDRSQPVVRSSLHRRRSQAVDLSFPARRRRRLP